MRASGVMRDASSMKHPYRVLVRKVVDLPTAVAEALDFLDYDFAGKRVWVKPNLLSPHPPEHSVTTDPELVRNIVRELKRRAAAAVWVADNPGGGLQRNVSTYIAPTGVVDASEGCFRGISETPVAMPTKSRFVPEFIVSRIVTEADVLLNVPVFKTHALTILTGAIKNLFGIIPGGQKAHLHTLARSGNDFGELLVDLYQVVPVPVLTVMDALRGMDGQNGPSGGRVLSIGKLVTSRNPVALDAVMAAMAGAEPTHIPTTRIAAERGLGSSRIAEIDVQGDFVPVKGFRLPSARLAAGITGVAAAIAYPLIERRPLLSPRRCTKCQRCADNCPVKAIAMSPFPVIDRRKCIMCYCCAELCPEKAMTVPGPLRGLMQNITGR
jgi:uncharacterized protein (DUF362 family)/NAD-dependent dihydropyrimidine dehydrogenase PreA subunit